MDAERPYVGPRFGRNDVPIPTLTERFVPNPLPDATQGLVHVGNPNLRADHATEYGLGADRLIGDIAFPFRLSLDLYRTNLRTPAQAFIPSSGVGYSYPINIAGAVYQGIEMRLEHGWPRGDRLSVAYSIDNAYPTSVPAQVAAASLIAGHQFLGVPLEHGTFDYETDPAGRFGYRLGASFAGHNNDLNEPPYLRLRAGIFFVRGDYRLDLADLNLTNTYAFGFTRQGKGVAYPGATGPIPLDAYPLPAGALTLTLSRQL